MSREGILKLLQLIFFKEPIKVMKFINVFGKL